MIKLFTSMQIKFFVCVCVLITFKSDWVVHTQHTYEGAPDHHLPVLKTSVSIIGIDRISIIVYLHP